MSDLFWVILMALGYLACSWVAILCAVASRDWKGDSDGGQYAVGLFWPIVLVFVIVSGFGKSANALGNRVKENRRYG